MVNRLIRTMSSQILSYLHRQRFHNLSGQPVLVFYLPCSKRVFSQVQTQFIIFQLVPTASCLSTGDHSEESGSIFFTPSNQVLIHIGKITPELSLLQAKHLQVSDASPWWQLLQPVNHLCGSSLDALSVHAITVLDNPKVDTTFHLWCHQCWSTEKGPWVKPALNNG